MALYFGAKKIADISKSSKEKVNFWSLVSAETSSFIDNNILSGSINAEIQNLSGIVNITSSYVNNKIDNIQFSSNQISSMAGYSYGSLSSNILTSDMLNTAIGKLEVKSNTLLNLIQSGNAGKWTTVTQADSYLNTNRFAVFSYFKISDGWYFVVAATGNGKEYNANGNIDGILLSQHGPYIQVNYTGTFTQILKIDTSGTATPFLLNTNQLQVHDQVNAEHNCFLLGIICTSTQLNITSGNK